MKSFGVDVAVLSWTGRGDAVSDTQGVRTDEAFPFALEAASDAGVGVAVHLEPYEGRSPASVREDLAYLLGRYGSKLARMKTCGSAEAKPIVYVYDAYHSPSTEWATVLTPSGSETVRGTDLDVVAIATVLERSELADLTLGAGFDGVYTYFATDGFTWGSSTQNWRDIAAFGAEHRKLVSLSAGPGYNDTRIRPWNHHATRDRQNGTYFRKMTDAAIAADPDVLSITSFNEWGEGTQIEPALVDPQPDQAKDDAFLLKTHLDYGGDARAFRYLDKVIIAKATWLAKRRQHVEALRRETQDNSRAHFKEEL